MGCCREPKPPTAGSDHHPGRPPKRKSIQRDPCCPRNTMDAPGIKRVATYSKALNASPASMKSSNTMANWNNLRGSPASVCPKSAAAIVLMPRAGNFSRSRRASSSDSGLVLAKPKSTRSKSSDRHRSSANKGGPSQTSRTPIRCPSGRQFKAVATRLRIAFPMAYRQSAPSACRTSAEISVWQTDCNCTPPSNKDCKCMPTLPTAWMILK